MRPLLDALAVRTAPEDPALLDGFVQTPHGIDVALRGAHAHAVFRHLVGPLFDTLPPKQQADLLVRLPGTVLAEVLGVLVVPPADVACLFAAERAMRDRDRGVTADDLRHLGVLTPEHPLVQRWVAQLIAAADAVTDEDPDAKRLESGLYQDGILAFLSPYRTSLAPEIVRALYALQRAPGQVQQMVMRVAPDEATAIMQLHPDRFARWEQEDANATAGHPAAARSERAAWRAREVRDARVVVALARVDSATVRERAAAYGASMSLEQIFALFANDPEHLLPIIMGTVGSHLRAGGARPSSDEWLRFYLELPSATKRAIAPTFLPRLAHLTRRESVQRLRDLADARRIGRDSSGAQVSEPMWAPEDADLKEQFLALHLAAHEAVIATTVATKSAMIERLQQATSTAELAAELRQADANDPELAAPATDETARTRAGRLHR